MEMEKLQRKIKKNTFVLFAGKQICIEDEKSCITKQLTHRVLGGVRGCIPTARASPSPKAVPGSGVHGPSCMYPPGCFSELFIPLEKFPYLLFLPVFSRRHIKALISMFSHTSGASGDHVPPDNWDYAGDLFGLRRFSLIRLRCICILQEGPRDA